MRTVCVIFLLSLFSPLIGSHSGNDVHIIKPPSSDPEKVEVSILPLDQGRAIMMLLEYSCEVNLEVGIFDESMNKIQKRSYRLNGERVIFEDLSSLSSGKYTIRFTLGEETDEHLLYIHENRG